MRNETNRRSTCKSRRIYGIRWPLWQVNFPVTPGSSASPSCRRLEHAAPPRGADGHVRGLQPRERPGTADVAVRAPSPTTWGCTGFIAVMLRTRGGRGKPRAHVCRAHARSRISGFGLPWSRVPPTRAARDPAEPHDQTPSQVGQSLDAAWGVGGGKRRSHSGQWRVRTEPSWRTSTSAAPGGTRTCEIFPPGQRTASALGGSTEPSAVTAPSWDQ